MSWGIPYLCRSSEVQYDHYAVAAASMELGLLYLETGRIQAAETALETTKLVDTSLCVCVCTSPHNTLSFPVPTQHSVSLHVQTCLNLHVVFGHAHDIWCVIRFLPFFRTTYKGYHLESRIHFRIHAGLSKIAELKAANS